MLIRIFSFSDNCTYVHTSHIDIIQYWKRAVIIKITEILFNDTLNNQATLLAVSIPTKRNKLTEINYTKSCALTGERPSLVVWILLLLDTRQVTLSTKL